MPLDETIEETRSEEDFRDLMNELSFRETQLDAVRGFRDELEADLLRPEAQRAAARLSRILGDR